MVGYYIIDSKADTSMGDNSSMGYWVVKQVITSLTHRHMNGICTTSGVASHPLEEGHKEHYIILHYITLHHITLHYISLHFIPYISSNYISSLTRRHMNGIYTTSGVASCALGEGHKEPFPATIANQTMRRTKTMMQMIMI